MFLLTGMAHDDGLEILQERAGDIAFAHEARRIYDVVSRAVKKRMFAVMRPNHEHPYLSRWNGVHVNVEELGVADAFPEVLRDLTLVFAWGTADDPLSGAYFVSPREEMPDGAIVIAYNVGKADRQPFRLSRAAKRARAQLSHLTKNSEMGFDEDIIEHIPRLLAARRTAFIHELRHAYDQLVRDDDGKMSDYMNDTLASDEGGEEGFAAKNFTTDDEMNAYIVQGIEDTIEDFERHSRGKPTKAKAKAWAPTGTALWNRFQSNASGAVKHYAGEDKLMKRAAARAADVWNDYVSNLSEGLINEAFNGALREVDEDLNDQIEDLMKQPEFKTLESFIEFMFDDERETYGAAELQALARNMYLAANRGIKARDLATAPSRYRDEVKRELEGYGLRFEPRKAQKATRGFSSPLNGGNRFAGNHGGSGFTNDYNREPDSGRTFDPNDRASLGMGSRRRG